LIFFFFDFVISIIFSVIFFTFPHFKINGTPFQRVLLTKTTAAAKVGVVEPFLTPGSS